MTGTDISTWIANLDIWPLVVMLVPYFFVFRKHGNEVRTKRLASLYQAIMVFLFTTSAAAIVAFDLTDAYLAGSAAVIAIGAYALRKHLFPYRLSCPECGREYNLFSPDARAVYVMDDNVCDACRAAAEPQPAEPNADELHDDDPDADAEDRVDAE